MHSSAHAASLGKIEVASHLGEPFFARIPVLLSAGERSSSLEAGIADASDYRILEVYRDPVVKQLQLRLKTDQGPYLEVTSSTPIRTGFFNLIIRITHDHLTQFKKFPVFLELADTLHPAPAASQQAEQGKVAVQPAVSSSPVGKSEAPVMKKDGTFKPYDGWARAAVYGPIVRGDMLSTIAQRLRIDDRYTLAQVVVALFEKNRDKFAADNFNLLRAGSMLKVPTAAEVERHSPREASRIFDEHLRRWKEMVKHSRKAAEEKRAQEERYKPRIRMGAAVAEPVSKAGQMPTSRKTLPVEASSKSMPAEEKVSESSVMGSSLPESSEASTRAGGPTSETPHQDELQVAPAAEPVAQGAGQGSPDEEIALQQAPVIDNQALKSVQLQLQQLQVQLTIMQQQRERDEMMLQWILTGIAAVILVMLVGLLVLLRRGRAAALQQPQVFSTGNEPVDSLRSSSIHQTVVPPPTASYPAVEPTAFGSESERKTVASVDDRSPDSDDAADATADVEHPAASEKQAQELAKHEEAQESEVDHLAEADVYLRYGMENEALKMVEQALKLDPQRLEAHVKKALVLSFLGDEKAMQASIREGLAVLPPEEHGRFLEALRELDLKVPEDSAAHGKGGRSAPEANMEAREDAGDALVSAGDVRDSETELSPDAIPTDESKASPEEVFSADEEGESKEEEQALDFDLSGFDPEAEDVRPAALTPSRLSELAGEESLVFDFSAADEDGKPADSGPQTSSADADEHAADGNGDDAKRLDDLLRQLDEEEGNGREEK
ncbi:MAG: hypothetical protein D6703_06020 [Zetaproteobacteria bacterium]|nr:MAG: hypothetical protein D6703_06020 [Zetaproteobacteria bacterium]